MHNVYQAAQGVPGPHSYLTPTLKLAQTIPARDNETERTARPMRRIYATMEAEYTRLKDANEERRRRQAERNFKMFGSGVYIVETMMSNLENSARAFSPDDGEDGDGTYSGLAERAMNDWSWKPNRNAQFSQFEMPALKAAPRGAAEMYRGETFIRS